MNMTSARTLSVNAAPVRETCGDLVTKTAPPDAAKNRARILIADDNTFMRYSVSQLIGLEAGLEVVGEAVNGEDAVSLARSLRPDIVIMDINMPLMGGIEATVLIKAEQPKTQVVGFSLSGEHDIRTRMLKAGAVDLLDKGESASKLVPTLHRLWAERGSSR